MTIDVNDNTIASQSITKNYGIQQVPTVVVVRSDGAVVTFIGESDTNTVKSAIEEAQHGKSIFPF
jgi:thioredoxin-like negative regulator of GroEL